MGLVSNLQSFSAASTGLLDASTLSSRFQTAMDGVLFAGRDITVHLPPTKSPCTDPDCSFNSYYKKFIGNNGQVCQTCGGQGFIVEPRRTEYRANIRWVNEPFNESKNTEEKQPTGRIGSNFVRTKTQQTSHDHIRESIGATIDGINVEVHKEPRYTGFDGNLYYVITWWKVTNR